MFRSASIPYLILLAVSFSGCGGTKTENKAVAVLNMQTVAMMTGADLSMQKAVQERRRQLNEGLAEYQDKLQATWKEKQKEFGDKPTEEQRKQLDQILRNLNRQSMQAEEKSRQNLMQFQQELVNKFRELVSPISLEVAKEHGYSVVIIENPNLIAFDTAINITDLVVERLKETKGEIGTLPTAKATPDSSKPGSELPELKQPNLPPLTSQQSKTKLKLPEVKTGEEKKQPAGKTPAKTDEKKPEAKTSTDSTGKTETAPRKKSPSANKATSETGDQKKKESKPAADKKPEEKPKSDKTAPASDKK